MSSLTWQYMHASVAMWISLCRAVAMCRIWLTPVLQDLSVSLFTPWSVWPGGFFSPVGTDMKESQIVCSDYRVP